MHRVLLPPHIDPEAAPAGATVHTLAGHSMGTGWTVRLALRGAQALPALRLGLQQQLDRVVAQMSHWEADSDLGRFNRAPAGSWHALPAEFFHVLAFAQGVSAASGGACDPGAGALVNLWGFGPEARYDQPGFTAPTLAQARALHAAQAGLALELDHAGRRARQPGGLLLDLSAVAKGYGVDCLARYLEGQGIRHYLVEVGGELRGAGVKPDGQPWWVALEHADGVAACNAMSGAVDAAVS
ncbi:MAG: FAD:protein FMN transferase, partial [Pseudomonadota bacterium]